MLNLFNYLYKIFSNLYIFNIILRKELIKIKILYFFTLIYALILISSSAFGNSFFWIFLLIIYFFLLITKRFFKFNKFNSIWNILNLLIIFIPTIEYLKVFNKLTLLDLPFLLLLQIGSLISPISIYFFLNRKKEMVYE